MSKYTAAQIKNWNVYKKTPSGGWIPARPLNPTGIITRYRHALRVLTGRYDVLDWEHEARNDQDHQRWRHRKQQEAQP